MIFRSKWFWAILIALLMIEAARRSSNYALCILKFERNDVVAAWQKEDEGKRVCYHHHIVWPF